MEEKMVHRPEALTVPDASANADRAPATSERSDLSIKMHALADSGHERADELREKANAFDAKTAAHYSDSGGSDTARAMLGAWARARRCWSECSGEPLV